PFRANIHLQAKDLGIANLLQKAAAHGICHAVCVENSRQLRPYVHDTLPSGSTPDVRQEADETIRGVSQTSDWCRDAPLSQVGEQAIVHWIAQTVVGRRTGKCITLQGLRQFPNRNGLETLSRGRIARGEEAGACAEEAQVART